MKSWKDLCFLKHPCTDIIIHDRYILKDRNAFFTIKGILENIFEIKKQKTNLLIITKLNLWEENEIELKKKELEDYLEQNNLVVNLSLAFDCSNIMKHDRKIISNYFYLDSGDSWNYFNENGTYKTNGTSIKAIPLIGKSGTNNLDQTSREIFEVLQNINTIKIGDLNNRLLRD